MKITHKPVLIILFIALQSCASSSNNPVKELQPKIDTRSINQFSGTAVSVADGDIIRVLHLGRIVKVHLTEIDCPEKNQSLGRKAVQFTSNLVVGKRVTVKMSEDDRYYQTGGEVFLQDGRSLNRLLLKAGLAWWNKEYSSDQSLGELERVAREQKIGLWQGKNPIPPWKFREGKRDND